MTDEEMEDWEKKIDRLSRVQMAKLWRFAESEHPVFCTKRLFKRFKARSNRLGGFSPEISKEIGWGP